MVQVSCYSPKWHASLLMYMEMVYPHRDIRYLDWWISNIDQSDEECWEKCAIILDNEKIIGCTTVNDVCILIDSEETRFFSRGNTIISPDQRGKGISKEIYNRVNLYDNWFSVGVTDIAWKIQPKYVKRFTPIRPVNVYISVNWSICTQLFRKVFGGQPATCQYPEHLSVSRFENLQKVSDINQIAFPSQGKWMKDHAEFVRDKAFFLKRYYDVYSSERYTIYQYLLKGESIGYVVVRLTRYKGVEMLSLVDYRFHSRQDEVKAFKAATKIAKSNNKGLVITLSSREYTFRWFPLTIKMKKKLNCAIGMPEYKDCFNDMLITSADSDLDFVYYK